MALGTADRDGRPWVTPVWYAPLSYREYVWVSRPGARHSRNIAEHPNVAITIYDSHRPGAWSALYMDAVAVELEQVDEALEAFNRRSAAQALRAWSRTEVVEPGELHGGVSISAGLAGTVMRFVPPVAALALGPVAIDGDQHARTRPMRTTIDALRDLGVEVGDDGRGTMPFTIHGTGSVEGGELMIDASASSQFVSGLLLAAACLVALAATRPTGVLLAALLGVAGVGLGAFTPANNRSVMMAAPVGTSGAVAGLLNMTRGLGTAAGTAVSVLVFTAAGGASVGMSMALAALAVLGVVGLLTE